MKATKLQIFDEIKNRLYNIKKNNGYSYDIERVEIQRLNAFKPNELPAINFYFTRDQSTQADFGQDQRTMTLMFESYTKVWDQAQLHELYFDLEEDITVAINRAQEAPRKDDEPEWMLNGLVDNISQPGLSPIITGSEYAGVAIELTVDYTIDLETRQ